MNRLGGERSPYLLQHAGNPVHWWPWGRGAFQEARRRQQPVFLSIGYSTCHWCHVMERECFENGDVAALMNEHFVSVKVDREERPDVDHVYMRYVVATTGHGGWPLSAFLTPEGHPFLGGTYFPSLQFTQLLKAIEDAWNRSREQILQAALQGLAIVKLSERSDEQVSGSSNLQATAKAKASQLESLLTRMFCKEHGGFSSAPKFPTPSNLLFMLSRQPDLVAFTLDQMARGGIHEHVGGGFHRYSVDARWHVPHFEKMLYDQAQLLSVYALAFDRTKDDETFRHCALDIIAYVRDRLTAPEGGFYSAEDADSLPNFEAAEKEEGAFALWTRSELDQVLGINSPAFCRYFGVLDDGNVPKEDDIHGTMAGKNILHVEAGAAYPPPVDIRECLRTLKAVQRPRPHLDDKILAAWNGYMITGLVHAYRKLGSDEALDMALKAAMFVKSHMFVDGRLRRAWRQGLSPAEAASIDYCAIIQAGLDLHDVTLDVQWKHWARDLQEALDTDYASPDGGYYDGVASDLLPAQLQEVYDGAEPSANSVALGNLVRLGLLFPDKFDPQKHSAYLLSHQPQAIPLGLLMALEMPRATLVKLFGPSELSVSEFRDAIARNGGVDVTLDFLQSDRIAAQVCRRGVCELPTSDMDVLIANLKKE
jgi:uncharacterized protein YyaL (SSP411 family)